MTAAAHVALIDDVVMHEGCIVQQLQGEGGAVGGHADGAPLPGHEHEEDGAHELALALGYALADAAQQTVGLVHGLVEKLAESLQLGLDWLANN